MWVFKPKHECHSHSCREKRLFVPCFAFELKDKMFAFVCSEWNALLYPFNSFQSLPVISLWVLGKSWQWIKPNGTPGPFNNTSGSHPNIRNQSLYPTMKSRCIIDIIRWKSTKMQLQHPEQCEKNSCFPKSEHCRPGHSTMCCSTDKSNQKQKD